ncbi:MAG: DsbA family oxidoreductase [Pseudomonadales bacterium]
MARLMQIEIFSDVVCPWCFIGKRRLDAVLASEVGQGIQVTWRPYQLYPQIPEQGLPRDQFMKARFGPGVDPADIYQRILAEAAALDLELDFSAIRVAPNTLRAHRLMSWAEPSGRQHELAEVLFRFYFQQGRDVGDRHELAQAAAAAGLDRDAASAMLAGHDESDKVRAELALGEAVGVTGVPFFVLAGKFAIPGAQPQEVMAQLISRARERLGEQQG